MLLEDAEDEFLEIARLPGECLHQDRHGDARVTRISLQHAADELDGARRVRLHGHQERRRDGLEQPPGWEKPLALEGSVVERRVPLPDRWVKGFSEVQVAVADLQPVFELAGMTAQRFLRGLPKGQGGRATLWAKVSPAGVRLGARPGGGAVCVAAPERLRVLESVGRYMSALRPYAVPDTEAASVWVAELPGARLQVTLSPHFSRGFSGEGGLLGDLADDTLAIEAEFLDAALHGRRRFTEEDLTRTGLEPERGRRALGWLGAHGRIGFDPVEQVWFRRELPFPSDALTRDPPRLRDAKKLVDEGAVRLGSQNDAEVGSGEQAYAVRLQPPRCSCPWWSQHPGDRGPCKHLLAAQIAAAQLAPVVASSAMEADATTA